MLTPQEIKEYLPSSRVFIGMEDSREDELLKLYNTFKNKPLTDPYLFTESSAGDMYNFEKQGKCIGKTECDSDYNHKLRYFVINSNELFTAIEDNKLNAEFYIWLNKYTEQDSVPRFQMYQRHWVSVVIANADKIMQTRTLTL